MPDTETLNDVVRRFWEQEPCGTGTEITGDTPRQTKAWFDRIEERRYHFEPFIHTVAQFTRHSGKKMLEVGVGAGTDHLQWARAGADCHGVDLTDAAIETTRNRLAAYGQRSNLQRIDAETLPFADNTFDLVYSWGVIHHSEHPERIIAEVRRVLKPGGVFIGMMYGRYSLLALRLWTKHALLKGKPWRSLSDVIWNHMESLGTKAYTVPELKTLFSQFREFSVQKILTPYEIARIPSFIAQFIPQSWGWYVALRGTK